MTNEELKNFTWEETNLLTWGEVRTLSLAEAKRTIIERKGKNK